MNQKNRENIKKIHRAGLFIFIGLITIGSVLSQTSYEAFAKNVLISGFLVIVLTPIVRVAYLFVTFLKQGEVKTAVFSLISFVIVVLSIVVNFAS